MMVKLSLSPYLDAFVQQAVASGRFKSVEQLIASAILLLAERERRIAVNVEALCQELRHPASNRTDASVSGSES